MPPNLKATESTVISLQPNEHDNGGDERFRCAILGCGMMGQEHISYIKGYPRDIRIDFLADPFPPSLEESQKVMEEFRRKEGGDSHQPTILQSEEELLQHANDIDLLVIASPNYMHTDTLVRWGKHDLTILVEKPIAVSQEQMDKLSALKQDPEFKARVWVAMEYRFIPAIAKLLSLIPSTIGDLKMITIRENRYPFLHKIGTWNRDPKKTGDTLVEKCCHFFDLFRHITGQEVNLPGVRALAQRGLNYQGEVPLPGVERPIIDSAYVVMPFQGDGSEPSSPNKTTETIGCLELCMYAEGSRHQEEIIVTGTKGRLEAYLPENKVFAFERPSMELWEDRSIPPPPSAVKQTVYNCSDVKDVHGISHEELPTHAGYHYSSTAVEWYRLLRAMRQHQKTGVFVPDVSLEDGMRAVEIGLQASAAIVNEQGKQS